MTTPTTVPIGHGSDALTHELGRLLADTYTLYVKTQGYHWNVIGPDFRSFHLMFEEQYTELTAAIDLIAERMRALGAFAPASLRAFARLSSVEDEDAAPEAADMVLRLIAGHEAVVRTAQSVLRAAEADGDPTTADLAIERLAIHEKTLWMLRATTA
jgi:starvation-inducible DNA-binding protein